MFLVSCHAGDRRKNRAIVLTDYDHWSTDFKITVNGVKIGLNCEIGYYGHVGRIFYETENNNNCSFVTAILSINYIILSLHIGNL